MPRNGSGVYSAPAGTLATTQTTIESSKYNAFVSDIVSDLNAARPITAGGTGKTNASDAREALGLKIGTDVQAYNALLSSPLSYAEQTLTATQQAQARANIGAPVGEFRNLLINPLFDHNQRVVSGTVVLAAGDYGHDRMRAGADGCTYTFSTSNGVTTLNISAGSLQQVIEAGAFAGRAGDYVLSWTGTATARIDSGSYGASGAVTATCDGSADVTVEFGTGTVSLPQFERSYVTDFSARPGPCEIVLCRYYYEQVASSAFYTLKSRESDARRMLVYPYLAAKRTIPALTLSGATPGTVATLTTTSYLDHFIVSATAASGNEIPGFLYYAADAEIY